MGLIRLDTRREANVLTLNHHGLFIFSNTSSPSYLSSTGYFNSDEHLSSLYHPLSIVRVDIWVVVGKDLDVVTPTVTVRCALGVSRCPYEHGPGLKTVPMGGQYSQVVQLVTVLVEVLGQPFVLVDSHELASSMLI